jgi:hypothetical protein
MSKPRHAYCSFCRRSYQDVGPLVEGPDNVYICEECIRLCGTIIDQEKVRRSSGKLGDLLRSAARHMIHSIESATCSWDPRIVHLLGPGDRSQADRFLPLAKVCQSAALLAAVNEVLKNVRDSGLLPAEAGLLEDIEMKVHQLQVVLSARADQEASP